MPIRQACRDCKRCTSIQTASQAVDLLMILCTAGLWLIVMAFRKRCPMCRHYAKLHTGRDLIAKGQ